MRTDNELVLPSSLGLTQTTLYPEYDRLSLGPATAAPTGQDPV